MTRTRGLLAALTLLSCTTRTGGEAAAAAQSAAPLTTTPVGVGTRSFPTDAARRQVNPSAGHIGPQTLIVWEDERRGLNNPDIFGAWTDLGTKNIGPSFIIAEGPAAQRAPSVAGGTNHYLVVWQQDTNGNDVRGAWLNPGSTVTPATFDVAATPAQEDTPTVTFAGTNGFVVAFEFNGGASITAQRYVENTTTLASFGTIASGVVSTNPSLTYDGTRLLLAYVGSQNSGDVLYKFVLPSNLNSATIGTNVVGSAAAIAHQQTRPTVAGDSNLSIIAWSDESDGGAFAPGVFFTRFSAGARQDIADGVELRPSMSSQYLVTAAAQTGSFTLVFSEVDVVTPATVPAPTGAPSFGFSVSGQSLGDGFGGGTLASVGNGGTTLALWDTVAYGNENDVHKVFFSGVFPNATELGNAFDTQETPVVASNGDSFLTAWADFQGGVGQDAGWNLVWRVAFADGGVGPANNPPQGGNQTAPLLSWAGGRYLMVWSDQTSLIAEQHYRLLNPDGTLASTELVNSLSMTETAVAPFGPSHLLVGSAGGVGLRRVNNDGGISALPDVLPALPYGCCWRRWALPVVASSPAGDAVAAMATDSNGIGGVPLTTNHSIVVARVALDGGITNDAGPLPGTNAGFPAIDFDGTNFFVAWQDDRNLGTTGVDLYGARVTPNGVVLDATGLPLEVSPGDSLLPHLSFNGVQHLLTWLQLPSDGGFYRDVRGVYLSNTGQRLAPVNIAVTSEDELDHEQASNDAGASLVLFTRFSASPETVNRIGAVLVQTGLGDPCGLGTDCKSGFCVAGRCCDQGCSGSCQTCQADAGATSDGRCTVLTSVCRVSNGTCDLAESCDGVNPNCPSDGKRDAGAVCRPDAGDCDIAETCDGVLDTCPADALLPLNAICQNTSEACANAGTCSGASAACPPGGVRPANEVCRPAMSMCDVAEACDGTHSACPTDSFASPTVTCRASSGDCDLAESCTGASSACPTDAFKPSSFECRASAGFCDEAELCTGAAAQCPTDAFKAATVECRTAAGTCDVAERCNGMTAACPSDALAPATTVCRPAVSSNDLAESCSGASADCPTDITADTNKPLSQYGFGCSNGCSSGGAPLLAAALLALSRLRRRRLTGALPLLVLLALAGPAFAAERLRLALLGVKAAPELQSAANGVGDYAQAELTQIGRYDVISESDIQTILGVERQRQLLGCNDEGCNVELAGALNAKRALQGSLTRVGDSVVLKLVLLDMEVGKPIHTVAHRVDDNGQVTRTLDEVRPMLYELINADPLQQGEKKLEVERGFGGVMLGLEGDVDLLGPRIAPGITAQLSGRWFGGALTILPKLTPGVRLEARFYPAVFGRVRPVISAGATAFTTGVAVRIAGGAEVYRGHFQMFAALGYERFVIAVRPGFDVNAVLFSLGVGYAL